MEKQLTNIIRRWKNECHVEGMILINPYPTQTHELIIYTAYPGWMIGKGGCKVEKYRAQIQKLYPMIKDIKFVETSKWYIK